MPALEAIAASLDECFYIPKHVVYIHYSIIEVKSLSQVMLPSVFEVEQLDPETMSNHFRLWLTSMPAKSFPVQALKIQMKAGPQIDVLLYDCYEKLSKSL